MAENLVQVVLPLPYSLAQSSMRQATSGTSSKVSQPQLVPTLSNTPATPMPASNGALPPPLLANGSRIQLDQPPNPRVKGQPLRVPQSSPSSTPSHWRRQRRASDVIDSSRMHLSPSAPSQLGSSLPRELLLDGPRTPTSPRSPLSDGGYGSSVFTSPVSPTRDQKDSCPIGPPSEIPPADELHPSPSAPMFVEKDAEEYNMRHTRRGRAIIINNDSFQMPGMADRLGSEEDVKSLKSAFETLQFDVTVFDNLSYAEISNILQQLAAEDHSDADCFCISVMTHGIANGYLLSRDVPYTVQSLWQPFTADKCPTLAGKPKLFFIQACRGDQLDSGVTVKRRSRTQTDSSVPSYKIPANSDFLLSYSSAEGYFSWRNPENGTWYIQCLSEELTARGHEMDILRILTRVSRRVALDHESFNDMIPWEHQCKQIPSFNSMLIRDLIFHSKE